MAPCKEGRKGEPTVRNHILLAQLRGDDLENEALSALLKNLGLAVRGGNYHIFLKEQAKDTLI